MDLQDVVVATVTWARSDEEAETLFRSLASLGRAGVRIIVADRGDHPDFLRRLATLKSLEISVATAPGLVVQAQLALAQAGTGGSRFILYTEPDKLSFFESGLCDFLRRAPTDDDVGVVLAGRSPVSFATFPPTQRYTEGVFNALAGEQLAAAGDYCYGPFLLRRTLLDAVARFPRTLEWGWRPATFAAARQLGNRLVHVQGEYDCPPEQRGEDAAERTHRIRQLSQNLLGLLQSQ